MSDNFVIANYYYNMGFNVSHIAALSPNLDFRDIVDLKAPSHDWTHYMIRRQSLEELRLLDWKSSIGIGVVLGYNKVRALDIDGCSDINILEKMLLSMGLSLDYPWIVRSGSHDGFHIIYTSEDHEYKTQGSKIKAFRPNSEYINTFKHIELRYKGHLVLPPSIHYTYNRYEFLSQHFPKYEPIYVPLDKVQALVNKFCSNENNLNFVQNIENVDLKEVRYPNSFFIEFAPSWYYNRSFLVIDCETTGLPLDWNAPIEDKENWPRLVQVAISIIDSQGIIHHSEDHIVKPEGFTIPESSTAIHGISNSYAQDSGKPLWYVLDEIGKCSHLVNAIVGHNISYDLKIMAAEFYRENYKNPFENCIKICTMNSTVDFCKLGGNGRYKFPKLDELYFKIFNKKLNNKHNAVNDVEATSECFVELLKLKVIDEDKLFPSSS